MAVASFIYPMKGIVGSYGCYFIDFFELYGVCFAHTHSFFIAVYRYVCIAHNGFLFKINWTPKVTNNFLTYRNYGQLIMPMFQSFLTGVLVSQQLVSIAVTLGMKLPFRLQNSRTLFMCQGRYEMYFMDSTTKGREFCDGLEHQWFSTVFCNMSLVTYALLSSNLFEIFLLGKCVASAKDQTQNVKELLSPLTFESRKK